MFVSFICLTETLCIKSEVGELNITPTPSPTSSPLVTLVPQKPKQVNETRKQKEVEKPKLSNDEKYMLAKIAMAEAEGESLKSKALVIATVLNRVSSKKFPNTIKEVIFQENQFSPTSNGRWERVEPNKDCYKALNMVLKGKIQSKGSLYFESCSCSNNWHSRNLTFLFEIDAFRFYK